MQDLKPIEIILPVGTLIRDIEDGDCYFEGYVVSNNPIKYKVTRVYWDGNEILDDEYIGQVIELKWYLLETVAKVDLYIH